MKLPFGTHDVYITLDDKNKIYHLHADFSKTELSQKDVIENLFNKKKRIIVLHKKQFELHKKYLLNRSNPNKISEEDAKTYYRMGFITKKDLDEFIN